MSSFRSNSSWEPQGKMSGAAFYKSPTPLSMHGNSISPKLGVSSKSIFKLTSVGFVCVCFPKSSITSPGFHWSPKSLGIFSDSSSFQHQGPALAPSAPSSRPPYTPLKSQHTDPVPADGQQCVQSKSF